MNLPSILTTKTKFVALSGAISAIMLTSVNAALVNVPSGTTELPGVLLSPGTSGLTGNVIASLANQAITGGGFTGFLNSLVVRNPAGTLDFYYQVQNTSSPTAPDTDIFRLEISKFGGANITTDATYRTDNLVGLTGTIPSTPTPTAGQGVHSADRDPNFGPTGVSGFGFDFDDGHFVQDPQINPNGAGNIFGGEASPWMVVRTNATGFRNVSANVYSVGIGTAGTFAPIPEPATALFGLALVGVCASSLRRRTAKNS